MCEGAKKHTCTWQTDRMRQMCVCVCACIESHHLELISASNCTGLVVWSQWTALVRRILLSGDPFLYKRTREEPSIKYQEKGKEENNQSREDYKQGAAIGSNDSRVCASRQVKRKQIHVAKPPCCERESASGDQIIFVCEVAVFSPLSSLLSVRSTL